ncbi:MAG TPA: condensation domain-containing protein, partial [Thermoanaerobaculia bacterium]|nr:condensation domain-containing protein [Thermoanaerobaculia bacterium]
HTSVELERAEPSLPVAELRQRVHARLRQETELVIAPDFFLALARHLPKIGRVEIHPKRGRAHNELTCFRYQVVLHVGGAPAIPAAPATWADWQAGDWSLERLRRALTGEGADALHLANIPNARVAAAAAAGRRLGEGEVLTVADLRRAVAGEDAGAVDPQDLWDLAAAAGWEADLGWSHPGPQGHFEAVLRRRGAGTGRLVVPPAPAEAPPLQRFSRYANQPLQGKFASRVAPLLRAFLAERLPEYMVPSALVALDALPLTPNGKIDYRALPAPEAVRAEGEAFVPPRTETERRLAEIWSEVLGVRRIGARDDFFAIGGHSLLATQVSSRVRVAFGADLPLRDLFEAHTLEALAARIEIAAKAVFDLRVLPIHPAPRDEAPSLSFSQERLWFLDQLEPGNSVYNLPTALRCKGEIQKPVLDWTYTEVVRRHETLRTTFPVLDGRVRPVIHPPAPLIVPLVDLRALPEGGREIEARRLLGEEARQPFDLGCGPVVRVLLLRIKREEHLLLSTLHHIAADAWSMWVFVQEVAAIYGASWQGLASPLPEPRIQYRDFARWQRQTLDGERLQRLISHWRERLGETREVLALPVDRPRPAVQTTRGGLKRASFSASLSAAVQALGQRENATVFMTLLTGFQALLYRYTGQEDLSVGTLIANRDRVEIETLIGCFINTLVLRHRLSGRNPFQGELARVREVTLDAYANPDLPFEKLVEELRPERDLSRPPLCQVLLVFQNVPQQVLELPGVSLQLVEPDHAASPFDMAWYFEEREGILFCTAEYNLDLFDGTTVQRMMGQLGLLLAGAACDPQQALDDLPLLSDPECAQLIREWNDTAVLFAADQLVPQRIRAVATAAPDAPAAFHDGCVLTYGELQGRADRLAYGLRRLGAGPDTLVGVCLERSLELVVAIVGVQTAGSSYLPLDPAYPKDRLGYYLRDSGAPLVLTGRRDLGLRSRARVSCRSRRPRSWVQGPVGRRSRRARPPGRSTWRT